MWYLGAASAESLGELSPQVLSWRDRTRQAGAVLSQGRADVKEKEIVSKPWGSEDRGYWNQRVGRDEPRFGLNNRPTYSLR